MWRATYKRDIKTEPSAKLKVIFVLVRWSAKRYDIYVAVKILRRKIVTLIENETAEKVSKGEIELYSY